MRMIITPALAALALACFPAAAPAAPCAFPMVRVCAPQPKDRPPTTPTQCRCENPPGSPTWGGKAELHKNNVPTVKPNKSPGANN